MSTWHGEGLISLSFAICAAQILIFHLAGECHNHQATGYSGLRNGGHSDGLSWKLFFTGVTETLISRGRKGAKEGTTLIYCLGHSLVFHLFGELLGQPYTCLSGCRDAYIYRTLQD